MLGQTLTMVEGTNRRPHKVTAVLKDYPSNTTLVAEIIASGKSAYAPQSSIDQAPAAARAPSAPDLLGVSPDATTQQLQTPRST